MTEPNQHLIELVVQAIKLYRLVATRLDKFEQQIEGIKMTSDEAAAALVALNDKLTATKAQLDKVGTEVSGAAAAQASAIESLKVELAAALAAAGNSASPALQNAIDAVSASTAALAMASQALDDLNADAPTPAV